MTTVEIVFEPTLHTYTVAGKEYPGVTTVLSDMGLYKVPPQAKLYHAARGTAIHDGCVAVDEHSWDAGQTTPAIRPYIEAYERFVTDFGFKATHVEQPVCSVRYRVAGTPDRIGKITHPMSRDLGKTILVDVKSGDPPPSVDIQMALYKYMAEESLHARIDECWALWLRDSGRYKVERSTEPNALLLGLSAVNLWWWRKHHGLLNET